MGRVSLEQSRSLIHVRPRGRRRKESLGLEISDSLFRASSILTISKTGRGAVILIRKIYSNGVGWSVSFKF